MFFCFFYLIFEYFFNNKNIEVIKIRLGKHVSIAGGIDRAPKRADEIGCNALQIFVKNPRGWNGREIDQKEIKETRKNIKKFDLDPLVVHSTYLINLATPKTELWHKSLQGLMEDYSRSARIEADFLVFHPGSHTGGGVEKGIDNISRGLNKLFDKTQNDTMVLLENVAGAGTGIGSKFQELYDIIDNVKESHRLGVCLDTCHAFSAGFDLRNEAGLNQMLTEFDEIIGLDKLKIFHINDSKHPLASNKDEHAHIGKGLIGENGFKNIINHPQLKDLPFILETPQFDGLDEDVQLLCSLKKGH